MPVTLEYLRTKAGKLDATGGNLTGAPSIVSQLRASKDPNYKEWSSLTLQWFELNTKSKPLANVQVRRALNHAIDRKRYASLLVDATGHFFPPSLLGYNAGLKVYEHDPEKAKALLKQAGYESGLELKLGVLGPNATGRAEQLLAQDLEQVGITAKA